MLHVCNVHVEKRNCVLLMICARVLLYCCSDCPCLPPVKNLCSLSVLDKSWVDRPAHGERASDRPTRQYKVSCWPVVLLIVFNRFVVNLLVGEGLMRPIQKVNCFNTCLVYYITTISIRVVYIVGKMTFNTLFSLYNDKCDWCEG